MQRLGLNIFFRSLLVALCVASGAFATSVVSAQTGMTFEEFKRKLQPYFDDELLEDLKKAMPQGADYRVWGWDVGDFSGDGVNDVAFSINILGTRKRECVAHMFVDNDGFLINIAEFTVPYVELPLEVGLVIRDTVCFLAQKRRAEYWTMRGYRYRDGSMILFDEFVSNRVETFGHEGYRNFHSLETRDKYINSQGEPALQVSYLTIPCYERGRPIYAGINADVNVDQVKDVHEGAFFWKGPEDASFHSRVVYDDDYLYLRIAVADSQVVTGWCDTCIADRLEIWLDVTPADDLGGSRYVTSIRRTGIEVRNSSDSGLYAIAVKIGDFADIRPSVKIRTTDDLDVSQDASLQLVRVVTSQRADGYVVKIRLPFALLGYARVPIDEKELTELGCTITLYDVDNEFRPEETSVLSTSPIQPLDPSTYGAIVFIPNSLWYGETSNIFSNAVFDTLRELGF